LITGQPHFAAVVQEAIGNTGAAVNPVVGFGVGGAWIIRCGRLGLRDISVAVCLSIVLQARQV